jgi:hypothetical protein
MKDYVSKQSCWEERMPEHVHLGKDDATDHVALPTWTQERFCDFVYDPQGTIPGNAMGKKHVVLSGFERRDWCKHLWSFFKHNKNFHSMASRDGGSPGNI